MSLWSKPARLTPASWWLYAAVAGFALVELIIAWLALHPNVPDDYRAYYLDKTTTCLAQPVTGAYRLGTRVDFRSGGPNTRELRPCGWEGPVGDGMHAVGETSRLYFSLGKEGAFVMTIEMTAVTLPGPAEQRVVISGNGVELQTVSIPPGETRAFDVLIPEGVVGADGAIAIALDFPDAISPGPGSANTRKRSIKLVAARIEPAP
jgi:hypothetical protein